MSVSRTVVLIPHYNSPTSLLATLESISADEVADVLVVDDGSKQPPPDESTLNGAYHGHGHVHLLELPHNVGIAEALNAGLAWIGDRDYDYIARLDAGDLNRPGRLAAQAAYLDAHPSVQMVGGAVSVVDGDGREQFVLRMPTDHVGISRAMRRNNAFMHPAVMFRSSVVDAIGPYRTDVPAAEDYEFFWRITNAGEVANLPDVVIDYELNPSSISAMQRATQFQSRLDVQREYSDHSAAAHYGMLRTRVLRRLPADRLTRAKQVLWGEEAETDAPARPRPTLHPGQDQALIDTAPGPDGRTVVGLAGASAGMNAAWARRAVAFCARGPSVRLLPAGSPLGDGTQLAAVLTIDAEAPSDLDVPALTVTDDIGAPISGSPRIAEAVRAHDPAVTVQIRDGLGSVLASGSVVVWRTVDATREQMLRVVGPLLVAAVRELPVPVVPPGLVPPPPPPTVNVTRVANAREAVRFAGRMVQRLTSARTWEISRVTPPRGLLSPDREPDTPTVADLHPAAWRSPATADFWADPFVLVDGDNVWILVEELDFSVGRGIIRLLEAHGDDVVPRGVLLRTEHHLSYPQVYRVGDRWLATVETCARHNPIYTFNQIGDPWRPADDLPPLPPHLADPTLIFDGEQLTGVVGTDAEVDENAVFVRFTLDSDGVRWRRDDAAVRVDVRNSRGGGTLDPARGLRVVQDCSGGYGQAVEVLDVSHPGTSSPLRSTEPGDQPTVLARFDRSSVAPDAAHARPQEGVHTLSWDPSGEHVWADGWHHRPTAFGWRWYGKERQHLDVCEG